MSETQIFALTKKQNLILLGECKNSFHGAKCIWEVLYKKYIPNNKYLDLEELQKVWNLQREEIDKCDKIILISTFDWFILYHDELPEYLTMLKQFIINHNLEENNNLKQQVNILEKTLNFNKYIGYVWNQTSVNECLWRDYNFNTYQVHFSIKTYYPS